MNVVCMKRLIPLLLLGYCGIYICMANIENYVDTTNRIFDVSSKKDDIQAKESGVTESIMDLGEHEIGNTTDSNGKDFIQNTTLFTMPTDMNHNGFPVLPERGSGDSDFNDRSGDSSQNDMEMNVNLVHLTTENNGENHIDIGTDINDYRNIMDQNRESITDSKAVDDIIPNFPVENILNHPNALMDNSGSEEKQNHAHTNDMQTEQVYSDKEDNEGYKKGERFSVMMRRLTDTIELRNNPNLNQPIYTNDSIKRMQKMPERRDSVTLSKHERSIQIRRKVIRDILEKLQMMPSAVPLNQLPDDPSRLLTWLTSAPHDPSVRNGIRAKLITMHSKIDWRRNVTGLQELFDYLQILESLTDAEANNVALEYLNPELRNKVNTNVPFMFVPKILTDNYDSGFDAFENFKDTIKRRFGDKLPVLFTSMNATIIPRLDFESEVLEEYETPHVECWRLSGLGTIIQSILRLGPSMHREEKSDRSEDADRHQYENGYNYISYNDPDEILAAIKEQLQIRQAPKKNEHRPLVIKRPSSHVQSYQYLAVAIKGLQLEVNVAHHDAIMFATLDDLQSLKYMWNLVDEMICMGAVEIVSLGGVSNQYRYFTPRIVSPSVTLCKQARLCQAYQYVLPFWDELTNRKKSPSQPSAKTLMDNVTLKTAIALLDSKIKTVIIQYDQSLYGYEPNGEPRLSQSIVTLMMVMEKAKSHGISCWIMAKNFEMKPKLLEICQIISENSNTQPYRKTIITEANGQYKMQVGRFAIPQEIFQTLDPAFSSTLYMIESITNTEKQINENVDPHNLLFITPHTDLGSRVAEYGFVVAINGQQKNRFLPMEPLCPEFYHTACITASRLNQRPCFVSSVEGLGT